MIKKRWIFFFVALLILCGLGLIDSEIGAGGFWGLNPKVDAANVAWMITATIFVLMMTPGLSFFYGGMVRAKNVISTMLQSFIAMGIVSVLWVFVGFSLAFGDDIGHLIGNPATFFMFNGVNGHVNEMLAPTLPLALYALFQMKFAIITPSLITGSFAERVRFSAYMVFMVLFCLSVRLLSTGPLDLASRRFPQTVRRNRLCRRNRCSRLIGCCSPGWSTFLGTPL